MNKELLNLPFTICFCIYKDLVLMQLRKRPPNENLWNGLGGKLEVGESPKEGVIREVKEESGIDLTQAESVHFVGLVTWSAVQNGLDIKQGMYAYIAYFTIESVLFKRKETSEGVLEWKKISWICNVENKQVIENIPMFLPKMLKSTLPKEYACVRENDLIVDVVVYPFV